MSNSGNLAAVEFDEIDVVQPDLNSQYLLTGDGRISLNDLVDAIAVGLRSRLGAELYMRDTSEGGDGMYHKVELVRVEGQLMLAPSEEGTTNV